MKLRLPARFEDMTLGMLQVLETTDDMLACLSAVTGQFEEQLRQLPKVLLEEGHAHVQKLRTREQARHTERFALDGVQYGFIPNWDEFTAGEYIDAEQYCADFWPNAHKLMALLFREVEHEHGDRYSIAPYTAKEDAERMKGMSADKVAGAMLFFWTTRHELLNTLRSSLIATGMARTLSTESGAGTPSSTRLRANRILKWMRSLGHRWGIYSRTWRF